MKRPIIILCLFLIVVSCNKRIVQLPETDSQTITQILDVSPAYFFYDEETKEVEFNRKNIIGTTNWLVNIDKRLTMEQVLPDLRYLQQKRRKDGLHTNVSAKNFFSCSNPDIQNLAFVEFTSVNYREDPIGDHSEIDSKENDMVNVFINFISKDEIKIEKYLVVKHSNKINFVKDLNSVTANDNLIDHILLNFNEKLTFQDYITFKSLMLKINMDMVEISKDEFVYN